MITFIAIWLTLISCYIVLNEIRMKALGKILGQAAKMADDLVDTLTKK